MRRLFEADERRREIRGRNQALQDRIHEARVELAILKPQKRVIVRLFVHGRGARLTEVEATRVRG